MISDVQPALAFDGLISSHPLYVPVTSADGIDATFDVISYNKVCIQNRELKRGLCPRDDRQSSVQYLQR